jgi:hypothetical protein
LCECWVRGVSACHHSTARCSMRSRPCGATMRPGSTTAFGVWLLSLPIPSGFTSWRPPR